MSNLLVVDPKSGKKVNMDDADAVRAALDDLQNDLGRIKAHIELAQAKRRTSGQFADPVWFANAKIALRHKGAIHQKLQKRLGELNRQEKQTRGSDFEKRFIEVARRRLTPEVFSAIFNEAHGETA